VLVSPRLEKMIAALWMENTTVRESLQKTILKMNGFTCQKEHVLKYLAALSLGLNLQSNSAILFTATLIHNPRVFLVMPINNDLNHTLL
jgi:hypothetical protein